MPTVGLDAGEVHDRTVRPEPRLVQAQPAVGQRPHLGTVRPAHPHVAAQVVVAGLVARRHERQQLAVRAPVDLGGVGVRVGDLRRFGPGDQRVDDEDLPRPVQQEPDPVEAVQQPGDPPWRFLLGPAVLDRAVAALLRYPCGVGEPGRVRAPHRRPVHAERVVGEAAGFAAGRGHDPDLGPDRAAGSAFAFAAGADERQPGTVGRVPRAAVTPAVGELAGRSAVGRHQPELCGVVVRVQVDAAQRDDGREAVGVQIRRAGQPEVPQVGWLHGSDPTKANVNLPNGNLDSTAVDHALEYVQRGTDRLALHVYPDPGGPAVVVWPAMGVPARYYRRFAADLHAAGLAVVVADLRGTGDSTPPPGRSARYGYADLVSDVAAVQEALKERLDGRRTSLLGHSLGGQLCVLHLALAESPAVDALVLVAVGLPYWRTYPGARRFGVLPGLFNFYTTVPMTSPPTPFEPACASLRMPAGVEMMAMPRPAITFGNSSLPRIRIKSPTQPWAS